MVCTQLFWKFPWLIDVQFYICTSNSFFNFKSSTMELMLVVACILLKLRDLEREVQKQKDLRIIYRKSMERTQDYLKYCLQVAQEMASCTSSWTLRTPAENAPFFPPAVSCSATAATAALSFFSRCRPIQISAASRIRPGLTGGGSTQLTWLYEISTDVFCFLFLVIDDSSFCLTCTIL